MPNCDLKDRAIYKGQFVGPGESEEGSSFLFTNAGLNRARGVSFLFRKLHKGDAKQMTRWMDLLYPE